MARRTAEEAERTRARIVECARARFADVGYSAATTTAIALDAGVSQSALFHHFADKRVLFATVIDEMMAGYDEAVRDAALSETEPVAMVLAGCRRSLELAAEPAWARIVVTDAPAVLDEATLRTIDAAFGRHTTRLGLELLVSTGDLDPSCDLDALTTVIYGSLTEAAFDLTRRPEAVDPDRIIRVIATLLAAHAPPTSVRARKR